MENSLIRLDEIVIRQIKQDDNSAIASVIRKTLKEFGANHPGTVYFDEATDHLYDVFKEPGSIYFIAEWQGNVVGGGGIFPSDGLPENTCELVKMYLLPEVRGFGLGKIIIEKSIEFAKNHGYRQIYLESMPELKKALKVYELFGFKYLNGPLGNTGHFGCELWMLKKI